jgi:hypothetical protein
VNDETRRARDALATVVITDTIRTSEPGMTPEFVARLVLADLRAYGLFDHECDDLCGAELGDHHVCGEDGLECGDECVCHGYSNDEDTDEDEAEGAVE